jgi:hypothetical protein
MTRPRPAVGTALAGMAILVMACADKAGQPPPDQYAKATAASPATITPLGQVKPVTVTIAGSACGHHVTPQSERLDKSNGDALGWRIRNNCAAAQKVLLCAYRGQGLFDPFLPCVSNPTTGLDIGRVFTVAAGQREDLDCVANVEGNYTKLVLVGNEVPASGCPRVSLQKDIILTHRLDVEIIP